jgi:putative membrane protein
MSASVGSSTSAASLSSNPDPPKDGRVTPPPDQDRLDVDVRFLLANERTLLAWLRTALTMQAGGVALIQLTAHSEVRSAVSLGLLALGGAAAIIGFLRYRAADRAIRTAQLPPAGLGQVLLTAGVVVLATVLVVNYAVDHIR